MQIERISGKEVSIRLTENQLRLMLGALREIGEAIEDFEFYARVGAQKSDVHKACVDLKKEMEAASIEI